jgi:hypothetical protein
MEVRKANKYSMLRLIKGKAGVVLGTKRNGRTEEDVSDCCIITMVVSEEVV